MQRSFTGRPTQMRLSLADTVAQAGRFLQSPETLHHARGFLESAIQQQPVDPRDKDALCRAQTLLAHMLACGLGGPADRLRAYDILRKQVFSSDQNNSPLLLNNARLELALLYIEDRATLETLNQARELLRAIKHAPARDVYPATRDRALSEWRTLGTVRPLNEQVVPILEHAEEWAEPLTDVFNEYE